MEDNRKDRQGEHAERRDFPYDAMGDFSFLRRGSPAAGEREAAGKGREK